MRLIKTDKTIQVKNRHSILTILYKILTMLCSLCCIVSCTEDEPSNYAVSIDTYVIKFYGDVNDFKGLVSVSTISERCALKSDSFNDYGNNSLSDPNLKESYEFIVKYYNHLPPKIKIQCTALCFADENKEMKMDIYKHPSDGQELIHKEFTFMSFPKGSTPPYIDYSYTVEL